MRSEAESVKRGRRGLTVPSRLLHRPKGRGHLSFKDYGTDHGPNQ